MKLADKFCIKMFQYIEISPAHAGAGAKKGHYNGEQFICHYIFPPSEIKSCIAYKFFSPQGHFLLEAPDQADGGCYLSMQ